MSRAATAECSRAACDRAVTVHALRSAIRWSAMLTPRPDRRPTPTERLRCRARSRPSSTRSPRSMPATSAICASAVAQLLKAALIAGPRRGRGSCCSRTATAGAAPSGCASCRTRSSACCTSSPTQHLYPLAEPVRSRAHGGRRHRRLWPRRCWRRAPTSICCSCCPTSRPPGASRSPRRSSIACGTWG